MSVTSSDSIAISMVTSEDWASIQVDFDDGVTANGWTTSATDVYSAMVDLVAWLLANYGVSASCAVAYSGGSLFTLGGTFDYVANAAAQSILGMSASESGVTEFRLTPASLLVTPYGQIPQVVRQHTTERVAASNGAPSPQANAHQAQSTTAQLVLDATQVARWRYCVEVATNPRQAYVWLDTSATWALASVGPAKPEPAGAIRYRMAVELRA